MQSDDEHFDDTVESLSPDRKMQDPHARFSLRNTPSRAESEKKKMENKNLFEGLTKRSEERSGEGPFSSVIFVIIQLRNCRAKNKTNSEKRLHVERKGG